MQLIIDLIRYKGNIPIPNVTYGFVYFFTNILTLFFVFLYAHQIVYVVVGLFKHPKVKNKDFKLHKIGVVISARNESRVIADLINSIRANDYPQELVNIFVIADNCTDNTAQICRDLGCVVFERFDTTKIGKGYALNFLFNKLHNEKEYKDLVPEAYIIMDADNIMKPNYITEINKVYDSGYKMVTSYRNSKNFGANWISSGYGYWFLHEARHLNNSRMLFKTSSTILGTGFLIERELVKKFNNWEFFMLTEDVQCTMEYVLKGGTIGYCDTAEFFDEQPESLKVSWKQRERWAKGYYQNLGKYGLPLIKKSFKSFACWDIFTNLGAMLAMALVVTIGYPILAIVSLACWDISTLSYIAIQIGITIASMYVLMFLIALTLCITEWKKINTKWYKKILYLFTFPIFMFTYYPIAITALIKFKKVKWDPIQHGVSKDDKKR